VQQVEDNVTKKLPSVRLGVHLMNQNSLELAATGALSKLVHNYKQIGS